MRPSEDIFILKLKNVKLLKVFNWQILCSDLYFEKRNILWHKEYVGGGEMLDGFRLGLSFAHSIMRFYIVPRQLLLSGHVFY